MKKHSGENLTMWNKAGARERYAMENGHRNTIYQNGRKCIKFTYSKYDPYQDANGATYDTERRAWVN